MKRKKVDTGRLAFEIQEKCPFVLFAVLTGFDSENQLPVEKNLEISIYLDPGTLFIVGLEKVLPVVVKAVPDFFCEIIIINQIDIDSRFKAACGHPFFIRAGNEALYKRFVSRAVFDYRVKCAGIRVRELRGFREGRVR